MANRIKLLVAVIVLIVSIATVSDIRAQSSTFESRGGFPDFLQAQKVAVLSTAVNGMVDKILHQAQDYVKKGDVLVQLDAELIKLEIDSLKARMEMSTIQEMARIKLQYSKDNLDSIKRLRSEENKIGDSYAASSKELREARQIRDLALQEQIKAGLEIKLLGIEKQIKQKHLKLHSIVAPMDGVIVPFSSIKSLEPRNLKQIEVGEMVISTQQPVMAMMKVDRLRVDTTVPANLINTIQLGQSARVYIEGADQGGVEAKVVYKEPTIIGSVQVFSIEVEFENQSLSADDYPAGTYPYRFHPGMRARVELIENEKED